MILNLEAFFGFVMFAFVMLDNEATVPMRSHLAPASTPTHNGLTPLWSVLRPGVRTFWTLL